MNTFSVKSGILERLEQLDEDGGDMDLYNTIVGVVTDAPLSERLRDAIRETDDAFQTLEDISEEQEEQDSRRKSLSPSVAERVGKRGSVDSFFERRVYDRIATLERALKEESIARAQAEQRVAELADKVEKLSSDMDSVLNKIGVILAQIARMAKRTISRGRSRSSEDKEKPTMDTRVDLTVREPRKISENVSETRKKRAKGLLPID